jgi:formylglycine-generating enzyme required for sulfatase activity/serine/threonine protein kinase
MWKKDQTINDRFLITDVLGGGGFGDAYRATDFQNKCQVAIKTLNQKQQNKIDFDNQQQKFCTEAKILQGLSHPHIVKVSELIEVDGLLGMVMEYIDGEDLKQYVERRGKLDEVEALRYIQQVGTALVYLHKENLPHKVKLLHRDIKPDNIMLRADNREAVLIDFGLAREYIDGTTMVMTEQKTHGYAPIEQYDQRGHFGAYTDVYALAATLYHLLTGAIPLPSNFRKTTHSLSLPSTLNPDISSVVENAIVKGLELYPKDRPQTMAEFLELLGLEVPSIPQDTPSIQPPSIPEPKPPVYIPAPTADTATSDKIDPPPNPPLEDPAPSFFEQMSDLFEVDADAARETSEINPEEYTDGEYIGEDVKPLVIIPPTPPVVTPPPISPIVPPVEAVSPQSIAPPPPSEPKASIKPLDPPVEPSAPPKKLPSQPAKQQNPAPPRTPAPGMVRRSEPKPKPNTGMVRRNEPKPKPNTGMVRRNEPKPKSATRRNFIKWLGFGGVGGVSFLALSQIGKRTPDAPPDVDVVKPVDEKPVDKTPNRPSIASVAPKLTKIQFTSVKLNDKGIIIAKPPGSAQIYTEALGNGVDLKMVKIPGSKFMMGSPESEKNRSDRESPQHQVTVPEFYLGQTLVTQAQYQAIMGNNPSRFTGNDKLPVEEVSWLDAVAFCEKLSQKTKRTYRLPSEAEWEYACRAGTNTPYAFGETINPSVVNYDGDYSYGGATKGEYRQKTTPVGSFPPNLFGLYDLHGNLWEWCLDEYTNNYNGAPTDGSARGDIILREENKYRVLRGGSWSHIAPNCRSADRFYYAAAHRNNTIGFRVVCQQSRTS